MDIKDQKSKRELSGLSVLTFELITVLLLFVVSLIVFAYFTNYIFRLKDTDLDENVFRWILPLVNKTNTAVMVFISFFASQNFLLPANIVIAFYFLFISRKHWYSIRIPVVALGSFLVMWGLKLFFQRPRPLDPVYEAARGFSYPSGHSMSAMTFYGLIIYIIWVNVKNATLRWLLTVFLILLIFLIGFSRIYLRVHYTTDVIAGFSMGIIWLVISLWAISRIEKNRSVKYLPK